MATDPVDGSADAAPAARSPWRTIGFTIVMLSLPVVAVALFEGFSSLVLLGYALTHHRSLAKERYTEADTLLGWVNRPNVTVDDMYGPGVALHTNRQRVRHVGDLGSGPPAGQRRLICSGDSFTLGYGVDDAHAWCSLLGARDTSLETVNMGQGGYGVDQAYLWYLRDGLPLHPDLHVFALINTDLNRMMSSDFMGYPKPRLVVDGAGVRAIDVPIRAPGLRPWLRRVTGDLRALRSFALLDRLRHGRPVDRAAGNARMWEEGRAVLHDLARRDSAAGVELLVVYLPTLGDYHPSSDDQWTRIAGDAAARGEFRFLNLVEPFRRLPPDSIGGLFIKEGELPYAAAAGHYTNAGNAWVAGQLARALRAGPATPNVSPPGSPPRHRSRPAAS